MKTLTLVLFLLSACTGPPPIDTDGHTDVDTAWQRPAGGEIVMEMFDGITVPATYLSASRAGRPGLVLMHGGESFHDRTSWPPGLVSDLVERDWAVLIPDMRGTGGSGGVARDMLGGVGIQDIKTYAGLLRDDGFGEIGLVTGTYVDGAVTAYLYQADRGQQDVVPVAVGYLTSYGNHTEKLAQIDSLAVRPLLFQYHLNFKEWPRALQKRNPGPWRFIEYDGFLLDTGLFEQNPQAADDLVAFFDTVWPGDEGGD
ncbi:MAG: pimeloyl-ACP methyl ester carboxylesterase [Kiritimatiellia bacterium]|jgi:pimeloyl-ACP methyl ester carboxylesterase